MSGTSIPFPLGPLQSPAVRAETAILNRADAPSTVADATPSQPLDEPIRLLVVGANAELRSHLRARLAPPRWSFREAQSGAAALEKLMEEEVEVVLLNSHLPDLDATEFQTFVRAQFPEVQILTLGPGGASIVFGNGIATYELSELLQFEHPARHAQAPVTTFPFSRAPADSQRSWGGMIGSAATMQRVYHAAKLVARRDTTVLVQGESGTGKDLVARAIHNASARDKQPFVVINCAAIPESLLEAELFGYTKGAFTGAAQSRIGRIHAAHGGTLFLDEIGDMPFPLQSKILRFLEQGEVQRIGGTDTLKVDCRVVAATNADLKKLVKQNHFREDLYYRLAVFPIQLPPLRERMEDLDLLIESFLGKFCPGVGLHSAARHLLLSHDWPGNVRELRNVLERASLFAESRREIRPEDILL